MDGIATTSSRPVVGRAKAYLKVRHVAVRRAMKELKLDGLLLTHPADLAYLTNFTGDDSVGLVTEKDFFLATDFRFQEQAELEAGWLKVRLREPKMGDCLAGVLAEAQVQAGRGSRPTSRRSGRSTRCRRPCGPDKRAAGGRAGPAGQRDGQPPQGEGRPRGRPDPQERGDRRGGVRRAPGRDQGRREGELPGRPAGVRAAEPGGVGGQLQDDRRVGGQQFAAALPPAGGGRAAGPAAADRLGGGPQGVLLGPDPDAVGRPVQPADQEGVRGRVRGPAGGDRLPPPRRDDPAGRPGRPGRDRAGGVRQGVRPRPGPRHRAGDPRAAQRCARPAARRSCGRA